MSRLPAIGAAALSRPLIVRAIPGPAEGSEAPPRSGDGPARLNPGSRGVSGRSRFDPITEGSFQRSADGDTAAFSESDTERTDDTELTEEEQREVEQLEARDQEVRTHEQAHVAAAGALFRGGPFYEFETGPDGRQYAVGGHVNIDTSEGRTPEETIQRAQQVRRAALAPAEPSAQDRAVAAQATRQEAEARRELAEQEAEEQRENGGTAGETQPGGDAEQRRAETIEPGASDNDLPRAPEPRRQQPGSPQADVGLALDVIG